MNTVINQLQQTKMKLEEIVITPDLARKYLECNICNRTISKASVKKYAEMMRKGEWYLSHQSIAFMDVDENKEVLVDGQHRLAAVIQANIPVRFTVIRHAVQTPYIDTARNRNFVDNLNIFNSTLKYSRTMMGILNLLCDINKVRNLTQNERQIFCDYYFETFKLIDQIYKPSKTKSGGCPLKAALFLAYNKNKCLPDIEELLQQYMYIFNTGTIDTNDKNGYYVKAMRDHYYLQNREFAKLITSNSISYKRKKLTSIFHYSINCYINHEKYSYRTDMESSMYDDINRQMEILK